MRFRVKEICKEKGLKLEELAEKMSITRITLTRNINGNPTIDTLEKIANALGCSVIDLFYSEKNDFTALVDCKGQLFRFDSVESLKQYLDALSNEN